MTSTALLVMDLTEKVFPPQADVVSSADWTASLG